jgi:hypothetical protein
MSNVFVRDLNLYLLMENMFSGTPVVYSTFLGYDVVAHHAGPMNRDTLLTLKHFDEQLHALQRASKQAPRPYHFVFLSDHGQSPGATFQQRYGLTIERLVERALDGREHVTGAAQDDESNPDGRPHQSSCPHLSPLCLRRCAYGSLWAEGHAWSGA